jgi:hypothetical protein
VELKSGGEVFMSMFSSPSFPLSILNISFPDQKQRSRSKISYSFRQIFIINPFQRILYVL